MNIFRKKAVSYVVLVATAFCMLFTSSAAAQAATVSSVTREITLESRSAGSADKSSWYVDYIGYNSVTKDTNTTYNNSPYSIKVVNNTYSVTEVKKTYKVKAGTYYRASAMVKCSGLDVDPSATNRNTGAFIGQNFSYSNSEPSTSGKWKKISYTFYTGDSTEYSISLKNGVWYGECKGTVWFDNVKLEELKTTDKWNVLTIFFTRANGTGKMSDGKKVKIKSSISDSKIKEYKQILNGLYDDMDKVTGGLMDVKNIDYRVCDMKLKDFIPYDYKDQWGVNIHCLQYNWDVPKVRRKIMSLIGDKSYQQIILIVPHSKTFGWWGLTGGGFNGINCSVIQTGYEDYMIDSGYPTNVFIHEMAHGLEHNTNEGRSTPIASLHSSSDYGYSSDSEADSYEWYKDYYRDTIKGGKGIDPAAYWKPLNSGKVISDDMTLGSGIY